MEATTAIIGREIGEHQNQRFERRAGRPLQRDAHVPNVRLGAGKTYTIVILGRVRTALKLETFVIKDQAIAGAAR